MLKYLIVIFFYLSSGCNAQLKLQLERLNSKKIPPYYEKLGKGGIVLELKIFNNSLKDVIIPLDTTGFATALSENIEEYYLEDNLLSEPFENKLLGPYGFVYQNGNFIIGDLGSSFLPDTIDHYEVSKKKEKRMKQVKKWGKRNEISENIKSYYNWYIMKNLITIKKKSYKHFYIFFNPNFIVNESSNSIWYYSGLKDGDYDLQFKIISNNNLINLLTPKQKNKLKNIFIGVLESNTLKLNTKR